MASAPALFHDVEQRFLKLSKELEAATAERDELRTAAAEHESGLAKLTLSLVDAGYSAVDVRWLFANGPTERTLCCQWRGRVVTSM